MPTSYCRVARQVFALKKLSKHRRKVNGRDTEDILAGTLQATITSQGRTRGGNGPKTGDFDPEEHLDAISEDIFTRLYQRASFQFRDLCRKLRPEI